MFAEYNFFFFKANQSKQATRFPCNVATLPYVRPSHTSRHLSREIRVGMCLVEGIDIIV